MSVFSKYFFNDMNIFLRTAAALNNALSLFITNVSVSTSKHEYDQIVTTLRDTEPGYYTFWSEIISVAYIFVYNRQLRNGVT